MLKDYLTVTALNKYIKYRFDNDINLNYIYLKGEITNFKRHSKGHLYFTIKDKSSQIQAIMFKSEAEFINFIVKDGQSVLVEGRVSCYQAAGTYQIYVSSLKLDGIGDLYLKFEKLKTDLEQKGYFSINKKRAIPSFPKSIAVITSDTGAVIKDIVNTIKRRYPYVKIILYPCLVQGDSAKYEIVKKIEKANSDNLVDLIILARGGGSFEDLYCFNEEIVAMAIYNSKIPLISAVGHETDFTISDFIADVRAATPTAAAELATPNILNLANDFKNYNLILNKTMENALEKKKKNFIFYKNILDKYNPKNLITLWTEKNHNLHEKLDSIILNYFKNNKNNIKYLEAKLLKYNQLERINTYKQRLVGLNNQMILLNPLNILNRGFALVKKENTIVKSIDDIKINDKLFIRVKDGNFEALVLRKEENNGKY